MQKNVPHFKFEYAKYITILLSFFFLEQVFAADSLSVNANPKSLGTTQLMRQAKDLLESGRLTDAVPFLEESLVRFSELEGDGFANARAEGMYQLGLCYLETSQFLEATELFQRFLKEYPTHTYANVARIMVLESLARLGDSDRLKKHIQMLDETGGFDVLAASLKDPANADTCRNALVELMKAYAQVADVNGYSRFIPFCDSDALSDLSLNYVLMEGGDFAVEENRLDDAQKMYAFAKTQSDLIGDLERRISVLSQQLAAPEKWVPEKQKSRQTQDLEIEKNRLAALEADRDYLLNSEYDLERRLRIAQCFEKQGDFKTAIAEYRAIYTDFPESRLADRCHYFAFNALFAQKAFVEAKIEGESYLASNDVGRFRDEVKLSLMNIEIVTEQWSAADLIGRELLAQTPIHRYIDQVNYLLGFIHFQQNDFETARGFFKESAEKWPNKVYAEESTYWVAMCSLFLGEFDKSVAQFEHYLNESVWSPKAFAEDSTYRLGMAYYGLENDETAKKIFMNFLADFPESNLESEACSMLGDLYGAQGDLKTALTFYERGRNSAENSMQFDYAVFQAATALELLSDWPQVSTLMDGYLASVKNPTRVADATVWLSKSWREQGDFKKAALSGCSTISRFGDNPQIDGFADIFSEIRDLCADIETGAEVREAVRGFASDKFSSSENARTKQIYFALLLSELSDSAEKAEYENFVLNDPDFKSFSAYQLVRFAQIAESKKLTEQVQNAYAFFEQNFSDSDARLEMSAIGISTLIAAQKYEEALSLSDKLIAEFPEDVETAQIYKLSGDALRLSGKFDEAISRYNKLIKTRAWRGPLTPEALYWTADCYQSLDETEKAFAFYQRVYVLYENHTEWVAKAYAGSIDCLQKLGRVNDVERTLREMTSNSAVAETEEGKLAAVELLKFEK